MSWADERLVAFDVETTGPDPETARIVTAAIAICGGGQPTSTVDLLADPGIEIPADATAVHGITTEHARANGQPAYEVISGLLQILGRYTLHLGLPLIAFNARFDLTVLDREARRHGYEPLPPADLRVVDPLVIDKHLHRYRPGSRKLDAQAAHYRARLDNAHEATSDAITAARLAWAIAHRGQVIRRASNPRERAELLTLEGEWKRIRHDLDALHAAQTRWAAQQARGLAEHFARKGTPQIVEEAWPVVPVRTGAPA